MKLLTILSILFLFFSCARNKVNQGSRRPSASSRYQESCFTSLYNLFVFGNQGRPAVDFEPFLEDGARDFYKTIVRARVDHPDFSLANHNKYFRKARMGSYFQDEFSVDNYISKDLADKAFKREFAQGLNGNSYRDLEDLDNFFNILEMQEDELTDLLSKMPLEEKVLFYTVGKRHNYINREEFLYSYTVLLGRNNAPVRYPKETSLILLKSILEKKSTRVQKDLSQIFNFSSFTDKVKISEEEIKKIITWIYGDESKALEEMRAIGERKIQDLIIRMYEAQQGSAPPLISVLPHSNYLRKYNSHHEESELILSFLTESFKDMVGILKNNE